jgi:NAD(P)-dependent dehydrogenase (short-subunit alcohol dehydrogenase family)
MTERTWLVTGAARGLGLEFCRQLASRGDRVIACPRREGESDLEALATAHPDRVRILPVDVADPAAVRAGADALGDAAIDVLVSNAGVYPDGGSAGKGFDRDAIETAVRVNAIAPLELASALLPALRRGRGRKIAHVTSLMGSIADNTSGGSYAYRISKAALNMATRNLAHELAGDRFAVLALHPGWVKTRMGGSAAPLEASASVEGMLRVIDGAGPDRTGSFLAWDGRELPW